VKRFELARRALGDLQNIWEYVSADGFDAADRLIDIFHGKRDVKKLLKRN